MYCICIYKYIKSEKVYVLMNCSEILLLKGLNIAIFKY